MPRTMSSPGNKKPLAIPRRVRAKPAWSEYLTEDNRFALTKEETLRRKLTLLSKNNVFNGNARTSSANAYSYSGKVKLSANSQRSKDLIANRITSSGRSSSPINDVNDSFSSPKKSKDFTALDLVSRKQANW